VHCRVVVKFLLWLNCTLVLVSPVSFEMRVTVLDFNSIDILSFDVFSREFLLFPFFQMTRQPVWLDEKSNSQPAGFEPARGNPIGFQV
jgi:hypothetical protein